MNNWVLIVALHNAAEFWKARSKELTDVKDWDLWLECKHEYYRLHDLIRKIQGGQYGN